MPSSTNYQRTFGIFTLILLTATQSLALNYQDSRLLSGWIATMRNEAVSDVNIIVQTASGEQTLKSDQEGRFRLTVNTGPVVIRVKGKNLASREFSFGATDRIDDLRLVVEYVIPPVHEGLVIRATPLEPGIDRRNGAAFRNTLFARDDQVFHLLDAGFNAGQHEGGGKSLEVRRFGFNTDHGGVNGGLKVLVDNFQQNQGTQGHGQGYLGQLKSLTPELVEAVDILNGPFSAEYGDFSGLGVVHIRLREELPDQLTARVQGGSYGNFRSLLAYSPDLKRDRSLISYEASHTDGPFLNPLGYRRDNITGNYTHLLGDHQAIGLKLNLGRNDFVSSGQLPLDEVADGRLDAEI
jgi:hypothetical protein